jgi:hypothetical protein
MVLDWKLMKRIGVIFLCLVVIQYIYLLYQQQPVWDLAVVLPIYSFILLSAALAANSTKLNQYTSVMNQTLALSLVSCLLAYCFYRDYASLGGLSEPNVFRAWSDQFAYYKMLDLLRNGQFNSEVYFYGLGYPVLGYLAAWLYPRDPYFVVNIVCYITTYVLTYKIFDRFLYNQRLAFLAATVGALLPFPRLFIVEPWNSTVTLTCYSAAILICTKKRTGWLDWIMMGLLTGIIFATRYVDVVLVIPVWLYYLYNAFRERSTRSILSITAGGIITILLVLGVLYTHKIYFGGYFQTPYKNHGRPIEGGSDQDLNTYKMRLGVPQFIHIYGSLVDAKSSDWNYQEYTEHKKAVFVHNLLYLFSPIGLLILLKQRKPKLLMVSFGIGILLFFFIYGSHPGSSPNCLYCHSAHYFKPLSPWLMLGGVAYFWELFTRRDGLIYLSKSSPTLLIAYACLSLFSIICTPSKTVFNFESSEYSAKEPIRFTYELRNRFNWSVPSFAAKEFYPHAFLVGDANGELIEKRMKVFVDPKCSSIMQAVFVPSGTEGVKQWHVRTWAQEQPLIAIKD